MFFLSPGTEEERTAVYRANSWSTRAGVYDYGNEVGTCKTLIYTELGSVQLCFFMKFYKVVILDLKSTVVCQTVLEMWYNFFLKTESASQVIEKRGAYKGC